MEENIQVVVRLRPMHGEEIKREEVIAVFPGATRREVQVRNAILV